MAYDLQEQEQIDELKAFWARWGNLITTLLLVASLAMAGWFGWQRWQDHRAQQASVLYGQLQQATATRDTARIKAAAGELIDRHAGTAYAQMGALAAARAQLDAGQSDDARAMLQWAAEHGDDDALRHLARLRLAGVLLDARAFDEALALLAAPAGQFAGQYANRRGDVLLAQGKRDEARKAYAQALAGLDARAPLREVVRLKLDALGGVGA